MPKKKNKSNKLIKTIFIIFLLIFLLFMLDLFLIRALGFREIDDINPEIPCSKELIEKSNVLWIIPKYNNISISENKKWCDYILNFNKTLGMHGVYHEFDEFLSEKNQEYLSIGIDEFEKCFGFKPKMFKPPQLKISDNNKLLIRSNNLTLKARTNQILHKVYHCEDTGKLSNKIIDLI